MVKRATILLSIIAALVVVPVLTVQTFAAIINRVPPYENTWNSQNNGCYEPSATRKMCSSSDRFTGAADVYVRSNRLNIPDTAEARHNVNPAGPHAPFYLVTGSESGDLFNLRNYADGKLQITEESNAAVNARHGLCVGKKLAGQSSWSTGPCYFDYDSSPGTYTYNTGYYFWHTGSLSAGQYTVGTYFYCESRAIGALYGIGKCEAYTGSTYYWDSDKLEIRTT